MLSKLFSPKDEKAAKPTTNLLTRFRALTALSSSSSSSRPASAVVSLPTSYPPETACAAFQGALDNKLAAYAKAVKINLYEVDLFRTPFLLDLIFRVVGIELELTQCLVKETATGQMQFYNSLCPKAALICMQALNQAFPAIAAQYARIKPTLPNMDLFLNSSNSQPASIDQRFHSQILLDANALRTMLPQMMTYLEENPEFIYNYQHFEITKEKPNIFEMYGISPENSSCFVETLYLAASKRLSAGALPELDLNTFVSYKEDNAEAPELVNIYMAISLENAAKIARYLNYFEGVTAVLTTDQIYVVNEQSDMSRITFNQALYDNDEFAEDIKTVLFSLNAEQLRRYQSMSFTPAHFGEDVDRNNSLSARRM
jgi:hypothetical protein